MELTIDKAGRIVIPKEVRDDLRLHAGDKLELERTGETVQLRPKRARATLKSKNGLLVFSSGLGDWDIQAAIEASREERMREVLK